MFGGMGKSFGVCPYAFLWIRNWKFLCPSVSHYLHGHLLTNLNQPWLSKHRWQTFADAIHHKGAPLSNCWGFIDVSVRPICRPGQKQRCLYNGHKRIHAIKFQSIAALNDFITNLYVVIEGKQHDSAMLAESRLLDQM